MLWRWSDPQVNHLVLPPKDRGMKGKHSENAICPKFTLQGFVLYFARLKDLQKKCIWIPWTAL